MFLQLFKITVIFLFISIDTYGQHRSLNLPRYDQKPLHFGFILGTSKLDFSYRTQNEWPQDVFNVEIGAQLGYTVGIISNLRLNKNFDFRFIPTFTSGERKIFFDAIDPSDGKRKWIERRIESALIVFPLELKWKTNRIDNHRWYILGGIFGAMDLSSKAKVTDDRIFKLQPSDFGIEFGVGIDIYFEYFKLSPQLRATIGKGNLKVDDNTSFANTLPILNTRTISWIFTFE